jgi:hypothetical protein
VPCSANDGMWLVPPFKPEKRENAHLATSQVEVWWNRGPSRGEETLVLRQPWDDQAQVIMLSFGQAYDLIDALNKAVEGV